MEEEEKKYREEQERIYKQLAEGIQPFSSQIYIFFSSSLECLMVMFEYCFEKRIMIMVCLFVVFSFPTANEDTILK